MSNADRFDELWNDYIEGDLDESGITELQQLLTNDEALLKIAADSFQTHRLLGLHAQDSDSRHEAFVRETMAKLPTGEANFVDDVMKRLPETVEKKPSSRFLPYAIVACVAAILLFTASKTTWRIVPRAELSPSTHIAKITAFNGPIQWTGDGGIVQPITVAEQNVEGGTLESLSTDSWAELTFRDGSTVTVSGRSLLTLSDHQQKIVRLRYGNLSADVATQPSGRPMLVHTPSADLSVLGTQFNVDAQPETTKLVVNEGLVRLKRLADNKEVNVEASHEVTASLESVNGLVPTRRENAVTTWKSDLESDVVQGKWVSENWRLATQLKKAIASGTMSKSEAITAYKNAASLDEQPGSVWATPEFFGSLVVLSVPRTSTTPVILTPNSRCRVRGRVYNATDVQFGISVNKPNGGFAGKFVATLTQQQLNADQGNFDIEIPINDFNEITKFNQTSIGKELRDWWCVVKAKSAKLEITHVELLSNADEI